jgi:hypothetical protein
MQFYQAKLVLCRFVTTKFLPLVEYAGKSNAAVTQADCISKEKMDILFIKNTPDEC